MLKQIGRIFHEAVNFVLPPQCGGCGRSGSLLCPTCHQTVAWITAPICTKCGQPNIPSKLCTRCLHTPLPLEQIRAAALFVDPLPKLIHSLKYRNAFALADPLGSLMVEAWPTWSLSADLVIPIPLHPKRKRERGYNQSARLAKVCAKKLGWKYSDTALQRVRQTRPQVTLNTKERRHNMHQAFTADPDLVSNKKILVIDDVCTTGATLAAAAAALLDAGALSVSAYCLARAQ